MLVDRRTDRHDETNNLIIAIRDFTNVPNNLISWSCYNVWQYAPVFVEAGHKERFA